MENNMALTSKEIESIYNSALFIKDINITELLNDILARSITWTERVS